MSEQVIANGEEIPPDSAQLFIDRWSRSAAAERANYQIFLAELCDLLGVERPHPATGDDDLDQYVFERAVKFDNPDGTTKPGRIDLYKRGCFVLEAKQGSERNSRNHPADQTTRSRKPRKGVAVRGTTGWDDAMVAARGQAERYAQALPPSDGWPPFIIVVDVGHSIELYSDFTRSGKTYLPFPDARSHRVYLTDLAKEEIRDRLRAAWTDPMALDPARRSAHVTRDVAARLARLARSLEESGHSPAHVAHFLMRSLFSMFAEDVGLLPAGGFTGLLEEVRRDGAEIFAPMIESFWQSMNSGGFSPILKKHLLRFNGGLFESAEALPLDANQIDLLIDASRADWQAVEPAIFGTLLERALDPVERHKLGAHYTPRAYVERLVMPTIIEPLREDWEAVRAAAITLANAGKVEEAAREVTRFHRRLCETRVLDPACGTGNFLYVTLEHMKRLEGEVLDALEGFQKGQMMIERGGFTVDPHQLLGIEINPRAAAIADLVLWIGYLQWHFRTRGDAMPDEPVLKKFNNIECRDAVLEYDRVEAVTDDRGEAVTRWDGRTYKKHAVTGEDVPDETARVAVLRYINARKAEWPEADYIVGNPPFIGNKRRRLVLGDGYVDALQQAHNDVPESVDFVMYWWNQAANKLELGKMRRFGLITTNSITQAFNRRVLENHIDGGRNIVLCFAIPDHPWVDSSDGAAVRIAMTVAAKSGSFDAKPILSRIINERDSGRDAYGAKEIEVYNETVSSIRPNLTSDASGDEIISLKSNAGLANMGVIPLGDGFRLSLEELEEYGFERDLLPPVIKKYMIGRDIVQIAEERFIIDFFGLSAEEATNLYPPLMQRVIDRVKPEREQKKREAQRIKWWIFAEPRATLRPAIFSIPKYIATCQTSKHRTFTFLTSNTIPDQMIVAVGLDDAFYLAALSSRPHLVWALRTGSYLEDRPRYNHSLCFNTFPFPACDENQKARIRQLGEQLDAHRKRQQALHPKLTITDMYNVLEKLRKDEPLTDKEKLTHDQGLVSVLKQIHDELDLSVLDAYGWPYSITDEEILTRLVELNRERAAQERAGVIRWLRPDYQNPQGAEQTALDTQQPEAELSRAAAAAPRLPWPASLPEQVKAVRQALADAAADRDASELADYFEGARKDVRARKIAEILATLAALGRARETSDGRFVA